MHKSLSPVRHSHMKQAKSEEEGKKRKRQEREARRLMERKAAQQNNVTTQLEGLHYPTTTTTTEGAVVVGMQWGAEWSKARRGDWCGRVREHSHITVKGTASGALQVNHLVSGTSWPKLTTGRNSQLPHLRVK